ICRSRIEFLYCPDDFQRHSVEPMLKTFTEAFREKNPWVLHWRVTLRNTLLRVPHPREPLVLSARPGSMRTRLAAADTCGQFNCNARHGNRFKPFIFNRK